MPEKNKPRMGKLNRRGRRAAEAEQRRDIRAAMKRLAAQQRKLSEIARKAGS